MVGADAGFDERLGDRVLRQDVAYEINGPDESPSVSRGLLFGKKSLVCVTSDRIKLPMPLSDIWKKDILGFCSIQKAFFLPVMPVSGSTYRWRQDQILLLETLICSLVS